MTALETFRFVAPEFATKTDLEVNSALEFASSELSESKFGTDYTKALAYLAAHFLAWQITVLSGSATGAATGGRIVSEKEGDLSRSYADNSGNQTTGTYTDNFERTAYGLEYLRIRKKHVMSGFTRMG